MLFHTLIAITIMCTKLAVIGCQMWQIQIHYWDIDGQISGKSFTRRLKQITHTQSCQCYTKLMGKKGSHDPLHNNIGWKSSCNILMCWFVLFSAHPFKCHIYPDTCTAYDEYI